MVSMREVVCIIYAYCAEYWLDGLRIERYTYDIYNVFDIILNVYHIHMNSYMSA